MTHIARLLLFSILLLSPVGSTLAAAADEPLGVLVVAHGSTAAWNTNVEAAVTIIQQHMPSTAAYLMGAKNRTPQEAYDELVAAGVQRIVIVPLLVSSYSSHYEQVRFIGRLRDDYPGSAWMSLTQLHGSAEVVGVTPALDAHPILADILSDRWLSPAVTAALPVQPDATLSSSRTSCPTAGFRPLSPQRCQCSRMPLSAARSSIPKVNVSQVLMSFWCSIRGRSARRPAMRAASSALKRCPPVPILSP